MSYEILVQFGSAMFLGLLIGIDRQLRHKPLGIKTSMVISVASCLITIVSIHSVQKYAVQGLTNMDPMRLAAQIVSGVGFIGAGVILRRSNDVISGLTTAAMVWAASALGIASGAGFYAEAFAAVLFIILAINLFPLIIRMLGPEKLREKDISVKVTMNYNEEILGLIDIIQTKHSIKHIKVKDVPGERQEIHMIVTASEKYHATMMYYEVKKLKHVLAVEVENVSS